MSWRQRVLLAVAAPLLVACAGPPPEPAPRPWVQERPRCPLPLVRGSADAQVPVRLRLTNETDESLSIYVDSCLGHLLAGDVAPGATALFPLPRVLYPYRGGVRIHAYRPQPSERYDSYIVPIGDDPVLTFNLSEESDPALVAGRDRPVAVEPAEGPGQTEPVQVHTAEGVSYASGWSEDRTIVVSWLCDGNDLKAHLAGPPIAKLSGPVEISAPSYDSGFYNDWELEEGMAPSVHTAGAAARALAEAALPKGVTVAVTGAAGSSWVGFFPLGDLGAALAVLACYE